MNSQRNTPLILGGHSFIRQLGNDPPLDEIGQIELVEACLDNGIRTFDTTYQPERIALGRALKSLGRRDEATLIAWNFFTDFAPNDENLGGPSAYESNHLALMCEQLQTDRIDWLVVHSTGDQSADIAQETHACHWKKEGHVLKLGMWHMNTSTLARHGGAGPYDFVVHPLNTAVFAKMADAFENARRMGLKNVACSPFIRGRELDHMAAHAVAQHALSPEAAHARLADHMLRFALFAPHVDHLIVAMRKKDWVNRNIASATKGPLNASEQVWLEELGRA